MNRWKDAVSDTSPADEPARSEAPLSGLPQIMRLAEQLARGPEHVELQGVVLHRSPDLTLAAAAAAAAAAAVLGLLSPALGLLGLLLVTLSVLSDLDGGHGWVRRALVVKDIGHNLIIWRGRRLPAPREPAFYHARPPSPPPAPIQEGPALLICAPLNGPAPRLDVLSVIFRIAGLAAVIFSALGLALAAFSVLEASLWGALALLVIGGLSVLRHLLRPPDLTASPAVPAAAALLAATRQQPPEHLTLSVALVEGLHAHADGLEILLRNYQRLLPPQHTRVLLLAAGAGTATARLREGLLRRAPADDLLIEAIGNPLPPRGPSAAATALRLGWRAATLQGDLSDTEALMRTLNDLDAAAGAGRW